MKIGLLLDELRPTEQNFFGGTMYLLELGTRLGESGYDINFFGYGNRKSGKYFSLGENQVNSIFSRVLKTNKDIIKNIDEIKKMDLVHSISWSSIPSLSRIKKGGTRFVFDSRTLLFNKKHMYNFYKYFSLRYFRPDHTLFCERDSHDKHKRSIGKNCSYIPVPVDYKRFRRKKRIRSDKKRILFATSLRKEKGLPDLLRSMEKVWEKRPDTELWLAGDGPMHNRMAELSRENKKIKLLGMIPHSKMHKVYDEADLLVHPSYSEGFSHTVLEALASGLPVVTTNVGGLKELDEKDISEIVNPGDTDELARSLERLLESKKLCGHYARRGIYYVKKNHSWDIVMKKIGDLYNSLG